MGSPIRSPSPKRAKLAAKVTLGKQGGSDDDDDDVEDEKDDEEERKEGEEKQGAKECDDESKGGENGPAMRESVAPASDLEADETLKTAAVAATASAVGSSSAIPRFYFPEQRRGQRCRRRSSSGSGSINARSGGPIPGDSLAARRDGIIKMFIAAAAADGGGAGAGGEVAAATAAATTTAAAALGGAQGRNNEEKTREGDSSGDGERRDLTHVAAAEDVLVCLDDFAQIAKELCGFPSFFSEPLSLRIAKLYGTGIPAEEGEVEESSGGGGKGKKAKAKKKHGNKKRKQQQELKGDGTDGVRLSSFLRYWRDEIEPHDRISRFFRLIKRPGAAYITPVDFVPYLRELLTFHPGLAFLKGTPEFQDKYARTVIMRVFYSTNLRRDGRITERELRRCT